MDNDINMNMTGKVVSVLIALLFIVVLAFPIANSLGNSDNGGGSGGGNTEDYTVINTLQDFYNEANVTFNYKSYQIYASSENARYSETSKALPEGYSLTLNMDTLNEYKNNISVPTGYDPMQEIPILDVGGRDYSTFTEFPSLHIAWSTFNGMEISVYEESTSADTTIDSVTAFNLTITDTHISWMITSTWGSDTDPATHSADYDLTDSVEYEILYPSNDDVGWIPSMCAISLNTSPYTEFYSYAETMEGGIITIACRFQLEINGNEGTGEVNAVVPVENISADNTITGRVNGGMFMWDRNNNYNGTAVLDYEIHLIPATDGKYKLSDEESTNDVWTLVSITDITDDYGNPITQEIVIDNAELQYAQNYDFFTMYSSVNTNPMTYGGENGNGGSDSGTSVGGVAGTLIKLVPILLIVGLLMTFIIPMVYKPN